MLLASVGRNLFTIGAYQTPPGYRRNKPPYLLGRRIQVRHAIDNETL